MGGGVGGHAPGPGVAGVRARAGNTRSGTGVGRDMKTAVAVEFRTKHLQVMGGVPSEFRIVFPDPADGVASPVIEFAAFDAMGHRSWRPLGSGLMSFFENHQASLIGLLEAVVRDSLVDDNDTIVVDETVSE